MKLSTLLAPRVKKTKNLASDSYMQSYIVMKPNKEEGNDTFRTALFRFGSWCYSGRVQLTASLALADLPHVIPALRMQQSRLEFLCDVSAMPSRSPFVQPMEFAMKAASVMEDEVVASEDVLNNLVERLSSMGLGDSISQWLEGDPSQSFFEFSFASTPETDKAHKNVELMCTKCYTPNGLVTICIYFGGVYYLSLQEGGGEQPLLDSKFPNVAGKGRGYQIRAYSSGVDGWDSLRKVSIWQTQSAMQDEMEARIDKVRQGAERSDEQKVVSDLWPATTLSARRFFIIPVCPPLNNSNTNTPVNPRRCRSRHHVPSRLFPFPGWRRRGQVRHEFRGGRRRH